MVFANQPPGIETYRHEKTDFHLVLAVGRGTALFLLPAIAAKDCVFCSDAAAYIFLGPPV